MKNLILILSIFSATFLFPGCGCMENSSFEGEVSAVATGIKRLSCGRIVVPIEYQGSSHVAIYDDGDNDFTLFLISRNKDYETDSVPVTVQYSGEKHCSEVKVITYEKEGVSVALK